MVGPVRGGGGGEGWEVGGGPAPSSGLCGHCVHVIHRTRSRAVHPHT